MILPGCDFHPSWQQAVVFDAETGAVAARKLAVRLSWMLRQNVGYPETARIESGLRAPLVGVRHIEGLIARSRIRP